MLYFRALFRGNIVCCLIPRLSILEQNELEGRKRIKLEDKENDDIEGKEEEADIDQPDEEMDTGTDYVCDYFDNGEEYDDDDDNLDEPCF